MVFALVTCWALAAHCVLAGPPESHWEAAAPEVPAATRPVGCCGCCLLVHRWEPDLVLPPHPLQPLLLHRHQLGVLRLQALVGLLHCLTATAHPQLGALCEESFWEAAAEALQQCHQQQLVRWPGPAMLCRQPHRCLQFPLLQTPLLLPLLHMACCCSPCQCASHSAAVHYHLHQLQLQAFSPGPVPARITSAHNSIPFVSRVGMLNLAMSVTDEEACIHIQCTWWLQSVTARKHISTA